MRMFLLSSDEDTLTGMRLAGVEGKFIKNREDFILASEEAVKDRNIGILLITKTLASEYPESVIALKRSSSILVTEIPDAGNLSVPFDSITRYVRDTVGINIE